jgi:type I restriction enzyme, R subunit
MITDINSEDRLVQATVAEYLHDKFAWMASVNRERLKQASMTLLESLRSLLEPMPKRTENTTTQAEVKVFILATLWRDLPKPPFTDLETERLADVVYDYVWQKSASGAGFESYAA